MGPRITTVAALILLGAPFPAAAREACGDSRPLDDVYAAAQGIIRASQAVQGRQPRIRKEKAQDPCSPVPLTPERVARVNQAVVNSMKRLRKGLSSGFCFFATGLIRAAMDVLGHREGLDYVIIDSDTHVFVFFPSLDLVEDATFSQFFAWKSDASISWRIEREGGFVGSPRELKEFISLQGMLPQLQDNWTMTSEDLKFHPIRGSMRKGVLATEGKAFVGGSPERRALFDEMNRAFGCREAHWGDGEARFRSEARFTRGRDGQPEL